MASVPPAIGGGESSASTTASVYVPPLVTGPPPEPPPKGGSPGAPAVPGGMGGNEPPTPPTPIVMLPPVPVVTLPPVPVDVLVPPPEPPAPVDGRSSITSPPSCGVPHATAAKMPKAAPVIAAFFIASPLCMASGDSPSAALRWVSTGGLAEQ